MTATIGHRHRAGDDMDADGWSTCPACGSLHQLIPDVTSPARGIEAPPKLDPYAGVPTIGESLGAGGATEPEQPTRRALRDQLLTVSGLATLPPVRPLVDGLLYRGTLAQMAGQPGSFKSFVTVGMACAVALGVPFEDHEVSDGGGPVVYVAAEGASGLRARILAWCHLTGVDPGELDGRLYVLPVPIQLGNRVEVAEALALTEDLEAALLVLDTRARCTVGLEENSSTEQGRAIDALEALIRATGCTVLSVHHASRSGTAGRGSNAWDGAVWSDLRVAGENLHATVTCHKHKDVADGCEHEFRMVPTTVPRDLMPEATEQQRSTLVAVAGDRRPVGVPDGKTGRIVRDIVRLCAGPSGLTRSEIRDMAIEKGAGRAQAYAAIKSLVGSGVLVNVGEGKTERFTLSTAAQRDDEAVA